MLNDAFRNYRQDVANLDESDMVETKYVLNEWARVDNGGFHDFINNGSQILQDGSNYTTLEFTTYLLRDAFQQAKLPHSFYEANKTINKVGLNYTKTYACLNEILR
ncbi:unnamed protein product [Lathyrus oleraceus]